MRKPEVKLGKWKFYQVKLEDKNIFNNYLKESQWPVNLWSANFPFIWAFSQSSKRTVLWRIIDDLLVIFILSKDNILSLLCLPFGPGDVHKLLKVLKQTLLFCKSYNGSKGQKTRLRSLNSEQLEYLQTSAEFNDLFQVVKLRGKERHYSIPELRDLEGKKFESLRRTKNRFYRKYPDLEFKKYEPADYEQVLTFNKDWEERAGKKYSSIFDRVYFREILKNFKELDMVVLLALQDKMVVGINISGLTPQNEGWGCICKASGEIEGLNEALVLAMVQEIYSLDKHSQYLNVGSDMGLEGLSNFKEKFRPVLNLDRYRLYLK